MLKRLSIYGLAASLALALLPLDAGQARADDNKEYIVKAAFIYNFLKFVQWPGDKAIDKQSHIDVCVIGDSPMRGTAPIFTKASTPKLGIILTEETNAEAAAKHCHIVFVSPSMSGELESTLAPLKNQPVVTVSDMPDFAENGGMIGFTTQDGKIKLVVNTQATAAAGLHVDAQLLEIAYKVIR